MKNDTNILSRTCRLLQIAAKSSLGSHDIAQTNELHGIAWEPWQLHESENWQCNG